MANNSGTFFNINDNDGIPLVGVSTDGRVLINHLYGNCLIGSTSVTGTANQPLQVSGGAYVSGSVGIGTTSPGFKVDLWTSDNNESGYRVYNFNSGTSASSLYRLGNDTNANSAFLRLNSSNNTSIGGPNALVLGHGLQSPVVISTFGSERLRVDGSGNVGIGTTNPQTKAHIFGTNDILVLESPSTTDRTTLKFYTNGNDWEVGARGSANAPANSFYIYDNAASLYRLVIDPSGNVIVGQAGQTATGTASQPLQVTGGAYVSGSIGIGTTSPGTKVDIVDNVNNNQGQLRLSSSGAFGTRMTFVSTSTNGRTYQVGSNFSTGTGEFAIYDANAGIERARIDSSGNVGIGTTNPSKTLHVQGTGLALRGSNLNTGNELFFYRNDGWQMAYIGWQVPNNNNSAWLFDNSNGNPTAFAVNGAEKVRIDTSGNVGIGTNNPSFPLQIGPGNFANTGNSGIAFDVTNTTIFGTFGTGGNLTLRAQRVSDTGGGQIFLGGSTRGDSNINSIVFSTANTDAVKIDNLQNVGIGILSPTSKLHVVGNAIITGITTVGLANTSTPPSNSQMSFELISNTNLRIKVRGTDGVLRSANITLV